MNLQLRAKLLWNATVKAFNQTRTAAGVALASGKDTDYLLTQIKNQKNVIAVTKSEVGIVLEDSDVSMSQGTSNVKGTKRQLARDARDNRNEAARLRAEAVERDEEAVEQETDAAKRATLLSRLSD